MNDDPDPSTDDTDAIDAESVEAWLDQAADRKGVSRKELMDQMLSSYWIFDELTGLVDGSESDRPGGVPGPMPPDEPTEAMDSDETGSAIEQDDHTPDRETVSEMVESLSPEYLEEIEENVRTLQSAVRKLETRPTDDTGLSAPAMNSSESVDGSLIAIVSYMLRQFEEIESELAKLDRIEEIESELTQIQNRQDADVERLSDKLQLALDRVDRLETEREEFVRDEDIDVAIEEIDTDLETLRNDQTELETRIEREFDSIESLFGDLIGTLDDLDRRIDDVSESHREEVEPLTERETERKRLEKLKTEALLEEERTGTCGNCKQAIDIGLLESARCPNCDGQLSGLTDSGWNPFKPPIIEADPPVDF